MNKKEISVDCEDFDELMLDLIERKIDHLNKRIMKLEDMKKDFVFAKGFYEDRILKKKNG